MGLDEKLAEFLYASSPGRQAGEIEREREREMVHTQRRTVDPGNDGHVFRRSKVLQSEVHGT